MGSPSKETLAPRVTLGDSRLREASSVPSTPAWRCLSTPDPGHEPCEAESPAGGSLLCHGALSLSPCFWAPPSARHPWLLFSAPSQPFRSLPCTHTSSPQGRKEKAALIAPGPDPPLGSDRRHLPSWLPGPRPAPASPLSALSGAAPRRRRPPSASPGSPRVPCLEPQAVPSDPGPTQLPLRLPSG